MVQVNFRTSFFDLQKKFCPTCIHRWGQWRCALWEQCWNSSGQILFWTGFVPLWVRCACLPWKKGWRNGTQGDLGLYIGTSTDVQCWRWALPIRGDTGVNVVLSTCRAAVCDGMLGSLQGVKLFVKWKQQMCCDPPAVPLPPLPLSHPPLFLVYLSSQGLCTWIPGWDSAMMGPHGWWNLQVPTQAPSMLVATKPTARIGAWTAQPSAHRSLLWWVFYFFLLPEGSRVIPSAQHWSSLIQALCPLWVPGGRLANLRGSGEARKVCVVGTGSEWSREGLGALGLVQNGVEKALVHLTTWCLWVRHLICFPLENTTSRPWWCLQGRNMQWEKKQCNFFAYLKPVYSCFGSHNMNACLNPSDFCFMSCFSVVP